MTAELHDAETYRQIVQTFVAIMRSDFRVAEIALIDLAAHAEEVLESDRGGSE